MDSSLVERREMEMSVLDSMYGDECVDQRQFDVWRIQRPPELKLKLMPSVHESRGHERDQSKHVVLHVEMGDEYPAKMPRKVDLEPNDTIHEEELANLKDVVAKKVKELQGNEMIMDLAQTISEFLAACGADVKKRGEGHDDDGFASEHAAMVARRHEDKIREETRLREARAVESAAERAHRQAVREEVEQRLQELRQEEQGVREVPQTQQGQKVENEVRGKRKGQTRKASSSSSASSQRRSMSSEEPLPIVHGEGTSDKGDIGDSSLCFEKPGKRSEPFLLEINNEDVLVEKVKSLNDGDREFAASMALLSKNNCHKFVLLKEFCFDKFTRRKKNKKKNRNRDDAQQFFESNSHYITSIQEVQAMSKVCHPNVVSPLGIFLLEKRLLYLETFVVGISLASFLHQGLPVAFEALRLHAKGVLQALHFMHERHFVHRDLRASSIFVDQNAVVKVTDFCLDKKLRECIHDYVNEKSSMEDTKLEEKDSKFAYPLTPGRGGKKADIYRLGLTILSLANGQIASENDLKLGNVPKTAYHFLKQALLRDERERWSAEQLLDHAWIKSEPCEDDQNDKFRRRRQRSKSVQGYEESEEEEQFEENGKYEESATFPFISSLTSTSASRLESEFSFIEKIGQGGFGLVMKVKNKLDGQVYAIKKIVLSQNQMATKKLVREVKLLSRLNHENVVRYYTSWIEVVTKEVKPNDEESSQEEEDFEKDDIDSSTNDKKGLKNAAKINDVSDIAGISFTSRVVASSDDFDLGIEDLDSIDDDDSSSSSSSEALFGVQEESSSHIVFDNDGEEEDIDVVDATRISSKSKLLSETRIMYIQMELCDRQTLRTAIDEERLNEHPRRMWRLFREIVEGLNHIHTQGMIHRDLKPMNIFLDRDDHVKIGDFGLATTNCNVAIPAVVNTEDTFGSKKEDDDDCTRGDKDLTGQIGTALYVAPEINVGRVVNYTQKVDVYSLGVIFFEMSYPPLSTGMERIVVINGIRSKNIKLPQDYQESDPSSLGSQLLRHLLDHDPARRPNTQELLHSDLLPPPQVEEASVHEMLKHTLSSTKSSIYRHLVDACLSQKTSLAQDISFDLERIRAWTRTKNLSQILACDAHVRRVVEDVFKQHGALPLKTPFLAPKEDNEEVKLASNDNTVRMMTRGGMVVTLPSDLRQAFARFLARAKVETPLRRYTVSPVFRELKVFGFHPREQDECAVDIVHSKLSLMADAEVLAMCDAVITSLFVSTSNFIIRLNHASLVHGVIAGCGVDHDVVEEVADVLFGCSDNRQERQTRLVQHSKLNDSCVTSLLNALDHEGSIEHVSGLLRHLARRPGPSGAQIKRGLKQLEQVVKHMGDMGIKVNHVIAPSMVCYSLRQYSGLIFQVIRNKRHRAKTNSFEVVASGGRYDSLIASFANRLNLERRTEQVPHAVGASFNLERISMALMASERKRRAVKGIDVIVHVGDESQTLLTATSKLLSQLWAKKIRALLIESKPLDEVHNLASQLAACVVVDIGMVDKSVVGRVLCLDTNNERAHHEVKKLYIDDICSFVVKHMEGDSESSDKKSNVENVSTVNAVSASVSQGRSHSDSLSSGGSLAHVNYHMRFLDKSKYHPSLKKRLEVTISAKISQTLQHFASNAVVEVFALQLPLEPLRSMKSLLNFDEDEKIFENSVQLLMEKHPRHRKVFSTLCDTLQQYKFVTGRQIFILYSCEQHAFTVIMTA